MIHRLFLGLALVGLAACNGPSPHFRGLPAQRVTVEGSTFDVRHTDRFAEAVRLNAQYAPRPGPIAARAAIAMHQVTGCRISQLRGDAAVILGFLDC